MQTVLVCYNNILRLYHVLRSVLSCTMHIYVIVLNMKIQEVMVLT